LTVPFARFVVQHYNEISFPFKRYQIQPVWRADKPQKGRYREFYQCDADVVGSDSLLNEVELIRMMDEVFHRFGIRVRIKLNNRKILSGISEVIGEADKIVDITVAIDKLDKIGLETVNAELRAKGLSEEAITKLQPIISLHGTNREKTAILKDIVKESETGLKGVEEIEWILDRIEHVPLTAALELDLTLARGLSYYTGAIFEVKALDVEIGSITGGGRYDNLTGVFGRDGLSGVGISFGADRIFDVLNQLDLYPVDSQKITRLMFVNFGEKEALYLLPLINQLRQAGVRTEIYPDSCKMKKQMSYADSKKIPFVAVVGENEMAEDVIQLKDMTTGKQQKVTRDGLINLFGKQPSHDRVL
jgi:histidyl-tRNA synthetase